MSCTAATACNDGRGLSSANCRIFGRRVLPLFAISAAASIDPTGAFSPVRTKRVLSHRRAIVPRNPLHFSGPEPTIQPFRLVCPTKRQNNPSTTSARSSRLSAASIMAPGCVGGSWCALASLASRARDTLHTNPSFVLSSVLLLSIFGVALEKRTTIGKALSAPLATMALAITVANLGFMPFSSPIYTMVNKFLVPLAVPLLLFDSDLRRVISDTGSLLLAFIIGAISTIIGTIVTFPLIPMKALGPDQGWRVACALAARHIGGAINFVAVADTLDVSGSAVSAAIAADNIVVALYFAFLFYLAKAGNDDSPRSADATKTDSGIDDGTPVTVDPEDISEGEDSSAGKENGISMASLGISITVSSCLVTLGGILTNMLLPCGTSPLPLTSILTVAAATSFPNFFSRMRATGSSIGILFMQMFFAASGAAGSIALVLRSAPSLFLFSALQIVVHFISLVAMGRFIFRLDENDLYLASNANVGGPTTAAAMAQAKNWQKLVLPALLIGILGYASATPIALALGPVLLRLPQL